jgi:hypothetical protein
MAENGHPQLCSLRQSQPFSIVIYAARIMVKLAYEKKSDLELTTVKALKFGFS